MTRRFLPLLAALALVPSLASAQGDGRRAWIPGESGFVLALDAGLGTSLGAGTSYTQSGRFEWEILAGYEFPYGLRPELGLVLGMAPNAHVGLRPGIHIALPETPFYVRAAVEWSSIDGSLQLRWLQGGFGGELRLTGQLSGFAELDLGMPLRSDSGVSTMVRAGVTLRL